MEISSNNLIIAMKQFIQPFLRIHCHLVYKIFNFFVNYLKSSVLDEKIFRHLKQTSWNQSIIHLNCYRDQLLLVPVWLKYLLCFVSKLREESEHNSTKINCAYINKQALHWGAVSLLVVPCAKGSLKIERQIFIPYFIASRGCFAGLIK